MIDEPSAATPENAAGPTGTGDPRVAAATAGLADLDTLPVSHHAERYADVHSRLQDILNEVGTPASSAD